ncbi:protein GVQW3 [Trichonephila clavipes]|nr:protein GVQW3 [Trichonephila clavipes]
MFHGRLVLQSACSVRWFLTEKKKMKEQKINLKFCFKLGKIPKETYVMLVRVHEDQVLSMKCAYEWFARFREGRESVSDKTPSGRPSTFVIDENIEKVKKLITKDRLLTVCMIADELHINRESVRQIITQYLGMKKTWLIFFLFMPMLTLIQPISSNSSWQKRE